jgi:Arc/MetJ-type ribon-helix-helix transcriptional regulator
MEGAIELPPRLAKAVEQLVEDGWYSDTQSLVVEAVRRFIATHRPELMDRFVREDVEWGLRGND